MGMAKTKISRGQRNRRIESPLGKVSAQGAGAGSKKGSGVNVTIFKFVLLTPGPFFFPSVPATLKTGVGVLVRSTAFRRNQPAGFRLKAVLRTPRFSLDRTLGPCPPSLGGR